MQQSRTDAPGGTGSVGPKPDLLCSQAMPVLKNLFCKNLKIFLAIFHILSEARAF